MIDDDDLAHLKSALRAAPPAPDPEAKAANLALAQKNFTDLQGTAGTARQTGKRPSPGARLMQGVGSMLNTLTTRAGLAATTGLVAASLAVVVVLPQMEDGIPGLPLDSLSPSAQSADENKGTITTGLENISADDGAAVTETPVVRRENRADAESDAIAQSEGTRAAPLLESTEELALVKPAPAPATTAKRAETESFAGESQAVGGLMDLQQSAPMNERVRTLPIPVPVPDPMPQVQEADTEAFANAEASPVKVVIEEPVSTFSIDVDTASYSVVRSSLMSGHLPPEQAVRVEEMVNYFPYAYPAPEAGGAPFQPTVTVSGTPWNDDTRLVHIALQGELPALEDRPPLNLVFLIDTSGSMQNANKLPLLKQSFRLMLAELRPEDQVSIVTYAGSAGQVLEPTKAEDRSKILNALDNLSAGGSTAGQAGLQQAYAVAEDMSEDGEVTRVILATDGDFNVGLSNPEALKDFIADKRDSGTYLSVLGFGRGNLDDATMQALAQNGNGQAAYIDTLSEARKVLVDQLSGALFPIANDVKIQVEFNPATVAEYRLIGYETRALKREDFNNDAVDAGEIGAGHAVTAIYEVTPVGSPAVLNSPLRYTAAEDSVTGPADELGFLRLRYKEPGEDTSTLIATPIPLQTLPSSEADFAAAIAGFGQLLKGSDYVRGWTFADAATLAGGAKGEDAFGYRAEAVTLMRLAESLSK